MVPLPTNPNDLFFGDHHESEKLMTDNEVMVQSPSDLATVPENQGGGEVAIMRIIERASTDPNFDVAKLEHLLSVHERWQANTARKAFVAAMASFKIDAPTIDKDKQVGFGTSKGKMEYSHATLGHATEILGPALAKHGFSYAWETEQLDGGVIRVTCVLTHEQGHSQRVSLQASPDTSGSKNSIQSIGSTVSYLSRYTFLAITGTATVEQDDDGETADGGLINRDQKNYLVEVMKDSGVNTAKFLGLFSIKTLDDLQSSRYNEAQRALETFARNKDKKGNNPKS